MIKFSVIVCVNKANAIGKDNKLLYSIKEDLKHFKKLTINNVVIMGRRTYESIGALPLKERINIVVTRHPESIQTKDNLFVVSSLEEASDLCENEFPELEPFIIGGATLYNEVALKSKIKRMYITEVMDDRDGDTYFPSMQDKSNWDIVSESDVLYDDIYDVQYRFVTLEQKKKHKDLD